MSTRKFLLLDANVLVDYLAVDLEVLALVHEHVGPVHIVSTVLVEVGGLEADECERFGFRIVEPSLDQVSGADSGGGPLSFQDRTCLAFSRDEGWICVTNDKALRRACEADGVDVLWGLELPLEVVRLGHLPRDRASRVATRIHEENPVYVSKGIVAEFHRKLANIGRR